MRKNPIYKNVSPMFTATVLAGAAFLLIRSEAAAEAAREAMKLCATVIVPSLFPYMVISSVLVLSGAAQEMGEWFARPVRCLFRLPGCAGSAFLLGALCGFPVGAKSACELYENGALTKRECERLIAVANNTGPSFVVEVVGAHFWGSRGMGICLYTAQIVSAVLIGWADARRTSDTPSGRDTDRPVPTRKGSLECLSDAVSSSARAVVGVCGFIVFFAVGAEWIRTLLALCRLEWMVPYVGAVLEFSLGSDCAARMGGTVGAFLTGFAVGWSGLSVFAQCASFTDPHSINLHRTAVCKGIQGILTGTAAAVYEAFFFLPSTPSSAVWPMWDVSPLLFAAEIAVLCLFWMFFRARKSF